MSIIATSPGSEKGDLPGVEWEILTATKKEVFKMKRIGIFFEDGSKLDGIIGSAREIKSIWNAMDRKGFRHFHGEPKLNMNNMYCIDLDDMDVLSADTVLRMIDSGDVDIQ